MYLIFIQALHSSEASYTKKEEKQNPVLSTTDELRKKIEESKLLIEKKIYRKNALNELYNSIAEGKKKFTDSKSLEILNKELESIAQQKEETEKEIIALQKTLKSNLELYTKNKKPNKKLE